MSGHCKPFQLFLPRSLILLCSTYDTCDLGTLKNQTHPDGSPAASAGLSYQPGQKLSACTCKGEDHPGPSNKIGRGGPEIDLLEVSTQTHNGIKGGEVSQSAQIAPYGKSGWYISALYMV